jgi:hypothetical protein
MFNILGCWSVAGVTEYPEKGWLQEEEEGEGKKENAFDE